MTLVSMTGFAEARGTHDAFGWRWEVKSVNGRGLDLRLRTPPGFESLETAARTLAAERFRRGSIQATLTVAAGEGARSFRVDPAALGAAVRIAREVAAETGLPPARVDGLLALKGVIVQDDAPAGDEARLARDAVFLEGLGRAFDALDRARKSEGAKLTKALSTLIDEIAALAAQARTLAALQPQAIRTRLLAQIKELTADSAALPEERIAQEIALLAVKADLREELDRLDAHATEARALLASSEPVGRKLDFLSQELNREANTLCSKSVDIALTRLGLALKTAIDRLREQVANVE